MELPDLSSLPAPITAADREELYDQFIAPALRELAIFAYDRGMSILCFVEWGLDDQCNGTTVLLQEACTPAIQTAKMAASRDPGFVSALGQLRAEAAQPEERR